jgi:hypothetical protein
MAFAQKVAATLQSAGVLFDDPTIAYNASTGMSFSIAEYTSQIDVLMKEKEMAASMLSESGKKVAAITQQLRDTEKELAGVKVQLTYAPKEDKYRALQTKNAQLKASVEALTSQLKEAVELQETFKKATVVVREKYEAAKKQLEEALQSRAQWKDAMEQQTVRFEARGKALVELKEAARQERLKLQECREQTDAAGQRIAEINAAADQYRADMRFQLQQREEEIAKLKKDIAAHRNPNPPLPAPGRAQGSGRRSIGRLVVIEWLKVNSGDGNQAQFVKLSDLAGRLGDADPRILLEAGRLIACGTFGCVFSSGPTTVMKIGKTDAGEVAACRLAARLGLSPRFEGEFMIDVYAANKSDIAYTSNAYSLEKYDMQVRQYIANRAIGESDAWVVDSMERLTRIEGNLYHGDLHGGNLVCKVPPAAQVRIIDWGIMIRADDYVAYGSLLKSLQWLCWCSMVTREPEWIKNPVPANGKLIWGTLQDLVLRMHRRKSMATQRAIALYKTVLSRYTREYNRLPQNVQQSSTTFWLDSHKGGKEWLKLPEPAMLDMGI